MSPKSDHLEQMTDLTDSEEIYQSTLEFMDPPMRFEEMITCARAAHENQRYQTACKYIRMAARYDARPTLWARLFTMLYKMYGSVPDLFHIDHRERPLDVVCRTTKYLLRRLNTIPKKERGLMPIDAIRICTEFRDDELREEFIAVLVTTRNYVKQWNGAMRDFVADERDFKFLMAIIDRTDLELGCAFNIDILSPNFADTAALIVHALDRCAINTRTPLKLNYDCVLALFMRWSDSGVYKFMRTTQLRYPWMMYVKKNYSTTYMFSSIWPRMRNHMFFSLVLPLVQQETLPLYPIIWILAWLFSPEDLPEIDALRMGLRLIASYRRVKEARPAARWLTFVKKHKAT